MNVIEFEIEGTAPLMFDKEPEAFEDAKGPKNGKIGKNTPPVEQARAKLHRAKDANGKEVAVFPAHILHKAMMKVTTLAIGRTTRGMATIVKGGIRILPAMLILNPQEWTLDSRRPTAKATGMRPATLPIKHRPRFDAWKLKGEIHYDDDRISAQEVRKILDCAGQYNGLGSWRIETCGPFGSFQVINWKEN